MDYQIINNNQDLELVCNQARLVDAVMLDTEFVRVRTFYPLLGLIQLYDGQQLSLIDPTQLTDMTPFIDLLKDTSVLKVLHACGEDLEVFNHSLGCVPDPMIDTQLMAAFLGHGLSTGFATLVEEYLGTHLDKSESRTDWLARPLTLKQLEYAAADVYYLLPLYQKLQQEITNQGWSNAVAYESKHLITKRLHKTPIDLIYTGIKGAWLLQPRELAILKPLAIWRHQEAIRRDLALNFVFKEGDLLTVAKHSITGFKRMADEGIDSRAIHRHGAKIAQIVNDAKQIPAEEYPEKIDRLADAPTYKQVFKQLKDIVKQASQQSGLATEFLASKKQINQVIRWVWQDNCDENKLPDVMQDWRVELVGEKMHKALSSSL